MEGKKLGIPEGGAGRVRPHHVDTGTHREFNNVDLLPTWEELKKQFTVTDVHVFFQEHSDGVKKPVVVVTFQLGESPLTGRESRVIREIEEVLVKKSRWGIVHHWTNPNGVITINCLKRIPR